MTSKQRSYLKGLAMNIDSIFQIGKSSLTPEITAAVDEALRRARTPDIKAEGLPVISTAEMGDLVAGLITER